jgi:hypothetical protein
MRRRHCAIAEPNRTPPVNVEASFWRAGLREDVLRCVHGQSILPPLPLPASGSRIARQPIGTFLQPLGAAGDVPAGCHNSFSVMQVPLRIRSGSSFRFI